MGDIDNGGGCSNVGARDGVWEISVPFLQFFCKSKTLFQKKGKSLNEMFK